MCSQCTLETKSAGLFDFGALALRLLASTILWGLVASVLLPSMVLA